MPLRLHCADKDTLEGDQRREERARREDGPPEGCDDGKKLRSPEFSCLGPLTPLPPPPNVPNHVFITPAQPGVLTRSQVGNRTLGHSFGTTPRVGRSTQYPSIPLRPEEGGD